MDIHNLYILNPKRIYVPPGNVGLCNSEHVDGGLVQFHKDTVEDLAETEKLKNLADFGADTIDTEDKQGIPSTNFQKRVSWWLILGGGFRGFGLFSRGITMVDKTGKKEQHH